MSFLREAFLMNGEKLLRHYENMRVYHGELHDHSASGGTSDGRTTLEEWTQQLQELQMDFAAILDHRQVRHMYLPAWKDGLFIAGTEPGTFISDCIAESNEMHYLIFMPNRDKVAEFLEKFPEYQFTGGTEGHFVYPQFTRERFGQLIDTIFEMGGFYTHPHPRQYMTSNDPCDYWFRDYTGIEVFYMGMESEKTRMNYELWTQLLSLGKRVYACAGGDWHRKAGNTSLTTLYAAEKSSAGFVAQLRKGDFTCGSVSVRMCMGDTLCGGSCVFDGQTLTVCTSDFHESVQDNTHRYRVDILDERGVVKSEEISCEQPTFVSVPVRSDARFYRAEVFDVSRNLRIAVGNPIWNDGQAL
jgi:hypothetical protein